MVRFVTMLRLMDILTNWHTDRQSDAYIPAVFAGRGGYKYTAQEYRIELENCYAYENDVFVADKITLSLKW